MIQASVIMPTCNKADRLQRVLESFAYQTSRSFEVVVCNDGSRDETANLLSCLSSNGALPYPLRVVHSGNCGAGAARNKAAAQAVGDIFIFNDDDMVPAPEYIDSHVRLLSGGNLMSRGERWNVSIETAESFIQGKATPDRLKELWAKARFSQGEYWAKTALTIDPDHMFKWLQSCTSNLAISREGFERANGFDEFYGTRWGAEDTDFGFCASRNGWDMKWNPQALNCHLEHSQSTGRKFESALPNFAYMKNKHNHRAIDALYEFVEMKVYTKTAYELFNEDDFTEDLPPQIVYA